MLNRRENIQSEFVMCTMEDMVPEESIYRKIDKYIDFNFIYEEVKDLYCNDNGRLSVDPVVLFKLVFIETIDGIKSMRKTCEKIKVDAEYRWFLGIPFGYDTPHFSTFSKNYERRFKGTDIFEKIFIKIVNQAIEYGLVSGEQFFTDSTHKKANANKNKYHEGIEQVVKKRTEWLEKEINEERRKNGKKEFEYEDEIEEKRVKVSETDKESGYYHRDNKEKGFMYLDHRTVDGKANIIVDCFITKGNVHDSVPFISRAEYIKYTFGFEAKEWGLDSGYDTLDIKKYFKENNIFGVIAYRRYQTGNTEIKRNKFIYEKEYDRYICPETGVILPYTGIVDKNGYKLYSDINACSGCTEIERCAGKQKKRVIRRHIEQELNEEFRLNRLSDRGKKIYCKRKETVERSFADSKNNHGYRYAMYKGIEKNQNYTWLICAAQNMKNIALKKSRPKNKKEKPSYNSYIFINLYFFQKNLEKITI